MDIKNRIEAIYDELIIMRRDFHAYPELSNDEFRTQNKIMNLLNLYGISNNKIANTGVVGIIKGQPGKTVALRADIDALPIQEVNKISYASKNNNIMHACGHDVHTAILLGTAKILQELKDEIRGQVKLMFQPAEETTGGALPMIKAGILENPEVNYVLGLHVMPYLETGKIEIKSGQLNAASDTITITVKGKKGHGAYPHQGHDAIVMTSQLVMALQTLVSRNISPLDSCVLSIGSFHGGNKANIICDEVVLKGTLRTIDIDTRAYAKNRIAEIVEYQVKALGGSANIDIEPGYEPLINNDDMVTFINSVASETIGKENIVFKKLPSLGVEDFSYFSNRVKGAFYHLGCKKGRQNLSLHHNNFDVDEACIKTGVLMQVKLVLELLNGKNNI